MQGKNGIAVVVGTVTNDERRSYGLTGCMHSPLNFNVCALRFTETARAKIKQAGGQCLTFDQLALLAPSGSSCVLLRGRRNARTATKHFGRAPGQPRSKSRPYIRSYGNKFENARGRRKSRGYKV